ncbi:MAG: gene transfer agent family protein [Methylobacterium frigidaeris]
MSRNGHVDLDFGGALRRFRLAIGDLESLQEATGLGPLDLLHRLHRGRAFRFGDVRTCLRLALVGGGAGLTEADAVVAPLDRMPCLEAIATATLVLAAALEGAADEPVGRAVEDGEHGPDRADGRIAFAGFYAAAAAMGLAPAALRAMSLWQFAAYADGFNRARDPAAPAPPTPAEEDALWSWLQGEPAAPATENPA